MYDLLDDGGAPTWPAHFPDPAPDPFGSDLWNLLSAQVTEGVEDVFSQVSARLSGEAPPLIERDDFIMPPAAPLKAEPTYGPMSTYGNDEPTEVEEVVITAQPGMPIDEINQILDDLYGGNGVDPNVPPTGGGGENGNEYEQPTDWNPCQDGEADDLASDVRDAIADMADSDRTEYGSLIYRDEDGNLRSTAIQPGTNDAWTPLNPGTQPSDFGLTSWSQVVGIVHSHPTLRQVENSDGSIDWVQVEPSHGHHMPNIGDWSWPDFMVQNGADPSNFRIYIVHDGQVHEYDYFENSPGSNRMTAAENTDGQCGA